MAQIIVLDFTGSWIPTTDDGESLRRFSSLVDWRYPRYEGALGNYWFICIIANQVKISPQSRSPRPVDYS